MTVNQTSTVVGIFKDRAQANQAMNALHHAGFDRSQIRYAGSGTNGNFFEDIKHLFAGTNASGGNIAGDLTSMGLSDEEAQYYTNEHNDGNIVVTVKAPGREQEALNILHSYNAYNYKTNTVPSGPAVQAQQPSDTAQGPRVQYQTNEQPYSTARDKDRNTQPDVATNPDNQQAYPTTNTGRPPAEPQSSVATNEHDTEFQNIRAQIQAVQQQLQDARAQLQSAKEREAQLQSAKEREKRLRDSKQQLQDLQSELQNTLAELRDTQTRIGQYK
jgi:vacuolar-type H+-ATPase subunit I/STV1